MPRPLRYAAAAVLLAAASLLTSTGAEVIAQDPPTGRVRVDPNLSGKDPFAARAARTARPVLEPAQKQEGEAEVAPPARQAAFKDALFLRGQTEPTVGEVLSISGAEGVVLAFDGKTRTYPLGTVERVEIEVTEEFRRGVAAFALGETSGAQSQFNKALELFQQARRQSPRRLEKEWATAKIVETYSALGRDDEAVSEFFILCRLDPYSVYLPSAPLRWLNQTTLNRGSSADAKQLAETSAAEWLKLADNPSGKLNPTGRLVAASYLLHSSNYGKDALDAIRGLVVLEPPDGASDDLADACKTISLLASAQLWRDAVLRKPTEREVARWKQTLELLPSETKLGPLTLVAIGEKSLGLDEQAAEDFLRVYALGSRQFSLAEVAAKEAADAFERLKKHDAARQIRADAEARFHN